MKTLNILRGALAIAGSLCLNRLAYIPWHLCGGTDSGKHAHSTAQPGKCFTFLSTALPTHHSIQQCGFAAAQCGKASPFRRLLVFF